MKDYSHLDYSIEQCEDLVADGESCTTFIRCVGDIRIRFTCPPGTAWENSLKTCVYTEQVEGCRRVQQKRVFGNFILHTLFLSS